MQTYVLIVFDSGNSLRRVYGPLTPERADSLRAALKDYAAAHGVDLRIARFPVEKPNQESIDALVTEVDRDRAFQLRFAKVTQGNMFPRNAYER